MARWISSIFSYPTFPNKNVNDYEIYFYFRLLYKYGILLSKNVWVFFYLGP